MTEPKHTEHREISIWFFCGILTLVYGFVLLVQGVVEWNHPPATVLSELRPTFYWGLLMTVLGGIYTARFRPRAEGR